MSRTKPYTSESLAHALAHHESRGVLQTVSPPCAGTPRWRVTFKSAPPLDLTPGEAYSLCVGLAAAEQHARAEHERFVRELAQRDGPICLDDELEHEIALLRRAVRIANGQLDGTFAPLTGFAAVSSDAALLAVVRRALDETKSATRCGIHGDDTTSGRCFTCDVDRLRGLLADLDTSSTLLDAESPYLAVVALCERQPRLIPVVLRWTRTEPSERAAAPTLVRDLLGDLDAPGATS